MERATNGEIAEAWRAEAFLPLDFVHFARDSARGEARGMLVETAQWPGRSLYMKPTVRDPAPLRARAAREKLASDFAYVLNVCVPPVVLTTRTNPATQEPHVCVSLKMFDFQMTIAQVQPHITDDNELARKLQDGAARVPSRALAFNLWVGQWDHGDDSPDNVIWGLDPADTTNHGFIFLDYAMAFGFDGPRYLDAWERVAPLPFPRVLLQRFDRGAALKTVKPIEALSDDRIRELVYRIPETHLPRTDADHIFAGLRRRRPLVRVALDRYVGEVP